MDAPLLTPDFTLDAQARSMQRMVSPRELEARVECTKSSGLVGVGGVLPPVLDACCGSRMFWFDRKDERAMFVDKRRETHMAADCSVKNGEREIVVDPDMLADFTALPFEDGTFALVVFDPPHIQRNGDTSWLLKKYGVLRGEWREMLRLGFAECFRVLRPEGTLIFKWNEIEVPLSQILALTPQKPLFGHRTGKQAKTHWVAFLKAGGGGAEPEEMCFRLETETTAAGDAPKCGAEEFGSASASERRISGSGPDGELK